MELLRGKRKGGKKFKQKFRGQKMMENTERIVAQAKLNKELKGLNKVKENKENSKECKFCLQLKKLIQIDKNSSKVWHTCQDMQKNRLVGLEEELPRCPKCGEFIGAIQTKFKGFYDDEDKLSKKDKHIHVCGKCGWKSREFQGTFVSRD